MQQQQGGGEGGSQYGKSPQEMTPFAAASTDPRTQQHQHQQQQQQLLKLGDPSSSLVEEASPISSRPPAAAAHLGRFEELILQGGSSGLGDEDALAALGGGADEIDRGGMSGGVGGNRWPRQETLALLKIRSDMDAAFRDATLKGPLWEDVSRKLAELGYKRSAKKCKEKFENVHKYYKRTKEGRAGRQDGKSYRFFSQLEALHTSTSASATTSTSTASPMPPSSVRIPSSSATPPPLLPQVQAPGPPPAPSFSVSLFEHHQNPVGTEPAVVSMAVAAPPTSAPLEISLPSDSPSSSSGTEDDVEDEDKEMELQGQRKRKRGSSSSSKRRRGSTSHRIREFFEGLMKQVMQKQEAMQQRFLEAIEKREQDRMIREEAWKRQEMARVAREHDLMAQERAISASREAAIIAFLQKITGQTIQLPPAVTIPSVQPPPPAPTPPPPQPQPSVSIPTQPSLSPLPPASTSQQQHPKPQQRQQTQHHQPPSQTSQQQHQQHEQQNLQSSEVEKHQTPISSEVVIAIPEQQVSPQELSGTGGGGSLEATSSRWPKAEVLELINLRSGLESRYQETGPKGPLWEEISGGMLRMGYKRSAKRCKEKWENINKYFKKVKESNKKRPQDARTCPYFHQLDALYKKKIIGSTSSVMGGGGSSSAGVHQTRSDQEQLQQQHHESNAPMVMSSQQMAQTAEPGNENGGNLDLQTSNGGMTATLSGEGSQSGTGGAAKKPEDIVKDRKIQEQVMLNTYGNMEAPDSDNIEQDEDDNYDDEEQDDEDEETEEDMKMAYQIQFQRHNTGSSNGGGNGAPSFFAMVQ